MLFRPFLESLRVESELAPDGILGLRKNIIQFHFLRNNILLNNLPISLALSF